MLATARAFLCSALSPAIGFALYRVLIAVAPEDGTLRLTLIMGLLCVFACVAVSVALTMGARLQRLTALAIGSGAVWGTALMILFEPTDHGLNGYRHGDAHFLAALFTKAYWYTWPVDSTYRGLSAHDPPLFFWILGKVARLSDMPPLVMRKWGTIAAYAQLVPLVFYAWRRLIGARAALVCALFSVLPELGSGLWKPHELYAYALFAPWWLTFVAPVRLSAKRAVLGGFLGAWLFTTFYYPFFVGAVLLLCRAIACSVRERRPCFGLDRGAWTALLAAAVFASWFWLPLALDFVHAFDPVQNRWYHAEHVGFAGFQGNLSLGDALIWTGVAVLVLAWPRHGAVRSLRALAGAAGLWLVIAVLATVVSRPLLFVKTWPFIAAVLVAAGSLGLIAALSRLSLPFRRGRVALLLLPALLPASQRLVDLHESRELARAISSGRAQPFRKLQNAAFKDKVILSTNESVCTVTPAFCFVARNEHFSHPSGQFKQRVAFLSRLVRADARGFCHRLRSNPYDAIDYIFVDAKTFELDADKFPNKKKSLAYRVPDLSAMPCLGQYKKIEGGRLYPVKESPAPLARAESADLTHPQTRP